MIKLKQNLFWLLPVVIVLLAVVCGVIFWRSSVINKNSLKNINQLVTNKPSFPLASSAQLPPSFPKDISIEQGTNISQNSFVSPKSKETYAATYEFDSAENLENNYNFYLSELEKNGWKILNKKEPGKNVSDALVYGQKNNNLLTISINLNNKDKIVRTKIWVVQINYNSNN